MPDIPSLAAGHGRAAVLTGDGELLTLQADELGALLRREAPPMVVHAPAVFRRLGLRPRPVLDLLELFAFVHPARPAAPTPRGLALALSLPLPATLEDQAALLPEVAGTLLTVLHAARDQPRHRNAAAIAARMGAAGWGWAPLVLDALQRVPPKDTIEPFRVWRHLPKWEDQPPPQAPASHPVPQEDARRRLAQMLGPHAEQRPGQADYASAASTAFAPRDSRGDPILVLAEAGTGTGKTLGYVAPASLWAERNGAPVWISTYTRHLQRQVEGELARLFPDPAERRRRVVVRKGRENYLCLLNYEEHTNSLLAGGAAQGVIPLGLVARWAMATADGDLTGGDLPGWMTELFGPAATLGLADRRGECIHGACPHYRTCFVEHVIRRARGAELVLANHALVLAQAAWGGLDAGEGTAGVPTRYVFDEGHHLFDAADGAFSARLTGTEGESLRRWLLGPEGGRSRARGLRRRLEDLVPGRPALEAPLDAALQAALALPSAGWATRLPGMEPDAPGEPEPSGPARPFEAFLHALRRQVLARASEAGDMGYGSLECDLLPLGSGVADTAEGLGRAIDRLLQPLRTLHDRLGAMADAEADTLEEQARLRIEAAQGALKRRAIDRLAAWAGMLSAIGQQHSPPLPGDRPEHVLLLQLERREGRERDVGLHRNWLDPTIPLALTLAAPAHGMLVTSATLRDTGQADRERAWEEAEARVGAPHLPSPAIRVAVPSPFDYAAQARAFVVTDVAQDADSVATAMRTLFLASGGGGLGLFTAIRRLQDVHRRIALPLEQAGISLLAQHVDAMDNATLVDVFRVEQDSCLLGTDAMRDGVDVPGRALRLAVFDRVPWPRRDILHRERRLHLSGGDPAGYDDRVARLRLRQAFGRLIRAADDRGVFVLLDRRMPSRLLSAFPDGVPVARLGLAETAAAIGAFLGPRTALPPGASRPAESPLLPG